jgi:hypothetical protein
MVLTLGQGLARLLTDGLTDAQIAAWIASPYQWRRLAAGAGYTRFRRVSETPFNIVDEARP